VASRWTCGNDPCRSGDVVAWRHGLAGTAAVSLLVQGTALLSERNRHHPARPPAPPGWRASDPAPLRI
jgi:hypothetical protein